MQAKRYLITSALPYINGVKHLGNLVGSMLPADVYSRFLRQQKHDVLFICGTDEHGTPAELAAAKAGMDVKEYCDKLYEVQKSIYTRLDIGFDFFGRTSSPQNKELTQYFGNKLIENGFVNEGIVRQYYSIDDKRFLPDRYVEGTCPFCGYQNARGDQCENCTKVLDPEQLLSPRSAISGSTHLELRESKHLFLSLKEMSPQIREWVEKQDTWSHLVKSIALKWLNEGLHDRCITRDLEWGVPVNRPGFEGKVYYVWFDAPIGYIAISKEWSDQNPSERDWKKYWYDVDQEVEHIQFMAKDNVPFHTISFPATLLATGEPWKKADDIKGFNWLTYYGGKFSTSQGRGIFTDVAVDILPTDYWRYYLMARAPEGADSSFTWEDFQQVCNKDLADVLGNLINRVTRFSAKKYETIIPSSGDYDASEIEFANEIQEHLNAYERFMSEREFRRASHELRSIWSRGNVYVAEQAPWTKPERMDTVLSVAFHFFGLVARLSFPFIPSSAQKIGDIVGENAQKGWSTAKDELLTKKYSHFTLLEGVLFKKIEDEQISQWKHLYGDESSKAA